MVTSRRDFLTEASAIGMGSYFLAGGILKADEATPQAPPASMVFETILTEGVAELSYLIGDKATGKAAVIDPRRDIDIYVELARKHKLTITHTLETNIHADLVSGCLGLADRTGTAKVCMSAEGGAEYGFPHEKLKDGDKIDLGRVILTARHTPGHTPEHMSYLAAESNHPDQFSDEANFIEYVLFTAPPEPKYFGGGHIEGALNIGPRAELSIWAGWMLDPKKPIFLVLQQIPICQKCRDSSFELAITNLADICSAVWKSGTTTHCRSIAWPKWMYMT